MLPRRYRLEAKDFPRVNKEGMAYFSPSFILKKLKKRQENSRFAFIVSKKISAKATERHRITRKAREAVRLLLPYLSCCFDVIIVARPKAKEKIEGIPQEIKELLKKANILR